MVAPFPDLTIPALGVFEMTSSQIVILRSFRTSIAETVFNQSVAVKANLVRFSAGIGDGQPALGPTLIPGDVLLGEYRFTRATPLKKAIFHSLPIPHLQNAITQV